MSGYSSHRTQELLFDHDLFCGVTYCSPYIQTTTGRHQGNGISPEIPI